MDPNKPSFSDYFSDPALVTGFYYPSEPLKLSAEQKKCALSPRKIPERECGEKQPITPETEAYIRKNQYNFQLNRQLPDHATPSPGSTEKFEESWPTTEKQSTLLAGDQTTQTQSEASPNLTNDSVISKYLSRFRNDPPKPREQRRVPSLADFWWGQSGAADRDAYLKDRYERSDLSNKEVSGSRESLLSIESCGATYNSTRSTVSSAAAHDTRSRIPVIKEAAGKSNSPTTPSRQYNRSNNNAGCGLKSRRSLDPQTPKTRALINKTEELINRSDNTTNGSGSTPQVTSSGVGSSDSTPEVKDLSHGPQCESTPESEPGVRPVLYRDNMRKPYSAPPHRVASDSDQENDILYQWRLKRRLEQAKHRVVEARKAVGMTSARRVQNEKWRPSQRVSHSSTHQPIGEISTSQYPTAEGPAPHHPTNKGPATSSSNQRTAGFERTVQTEPETKLITTQTTPTVDPLTAAGRNPQCECSHLRHHSVPGCQQHCDCGINQLPSRMRCSWHPRVMTQRCPNPCHQHCDDHTVMTHGHASGGTCSSNSATLIDDINRPGYEQANQTNNNNEQSQADPLVQSVIFNHVRWTNQPEAAEKSTQNGLMADVTNIDQKPEIPNVTPVSRAVHQVARQRLFNMNDETVQASTPIQTTSSGSSLVSDIRRPVTQPMKHLQPGSQSIDEPVSKPRLTTQTQPEFQPVDQVHRRLIKQSEFQPIGITETEIRPVNCSQNTSQNVEPQNQPTAQLTAAATSSRLSPSRSNKGTSTAVGTSNLRPSIAADQYQPLTEHFQSLHTPASINETDKLSPLPRQPTSQSDNSSDENHSQSLSEVSSDGDFSEDDILIALREQRRQLLIRIRELDMASSDGAVEPNQELH